MVKTQAIQGLGADLLPWMNGPKLNSVFETYDQKCFGPATTTPWPDLRGKCVRALKAQVPGEHTKEHKFVTNKARYFIYLNYMSQGITTEKKIMSHPGQRRVTLPVVI